MRFSVTLRKIVAVVVSLSPLACVAVEVVPPIPMVASLPSAPAAGFLPLPPSVAPSLPLAPLPRVKGGAFDLRFVNVGQLVDLLYGDAMHTPHVISSDVLQDQRVVSF